MNLPEKLKNGDDFKRGVLIISKAAKSGATTGQSGSTGLHPALQSASCSRTVWLHPVAGARRDIPVISSWCLNHSR